MAATTLSQVIQWYWHHGGSKHAYDEVRNAELENGFRSRATVVKVCVADAVHTVYLCKTPMRVAENGATVTRISRNMYVAM